MSNQSAPRKSLLTVFALAAATFVALAIGLEAIARTPWVEKALPLRSVGEYQYQFEMKWFRLQEYVKVHGGVDVIILGSSLVNTGVDPEVIARTFSNGTGADLRVFNFGVEGLTVAPNSVLARILVARYHPSLLIFVTEMRDYAANNGLDTETAFLSNPWLRYQSGSFNLTGWAVDHSAALQEYLPYRNWVRSDFFTRLSAYRLQSHETDASGYEPDHRIGQGVDLPPDPNNPVDAFNFTAFRNYQISLRRLLALENVLALGKDGKTAVMVVEMPVSPTAFAYFGGEVVHAQFQEVIASVVQSSDGLFVPWNACSYIPSDGRSDRWHLNQKGAPVFSVCLGEQLVVQSLQPASIIHGLGEASAK